MAGYNPNYFNRNLLDSMKKTIVEGLGDTNLGIGGEGDWGKVSDLQLQNRMRQYKQRGFLGAEVPEEKQNKEYLAAKKELERRQAAKQPKTEPAVPGLKGQATGADQRDMDRAKEAATAAAAAATAAVPPSNVQMPAISQPLSTEQTPKFAPAGFARPKAPETGAAAPIPMRPLPGHANPILPDKKFYEKLPE